MFLLSTPKILGVFFSLPGDLKLPLFPGATFWPLPGLKILKLEICERKTRARV